MTLRQKQNKVTRMAPWALFMLGAVLEAFAQSPAEGLHPIMSVAPSEIHGVVLFPDGITPVAKFEVKVWDAKRERYIFKTKTDGEGNFSVPSPGLGRFYLIVGRLTIDLELLSAGGDEDQPHDIIIAIPRPFLVANPSFPLLPVFFFTPPSQPKVISP